MNVALHLAEEYSDFYMYKSDEETDGEPPGINGPYVRKGVFESSLAPSTLPVTLTWD